MHFLSILISANRHGVMSNNQYENSLAIIAINQFCHTKLSLLYMAISSLPFPTFVYWVHEQIHIELPILILWMWFQCPILVGLYIVLFFSAIVILVPSLYYHES